MKATKKQLDRINEVWPESGKETLGECPVCGGKKRDVLHEGLQDRVFFCSPGKWTMYRCVDCRCGYIDPRPSPDTIHLAYENYFTHTPPPEFSELGMAAKVRRVLSNGYRNWRYGTKDYPSSWLGVLAALVMPNGRAVIDAGMRHLSKPMPGQALLDIGCGNGAFLLRAKSAGWDVAGLDFDPKAVEEARKKGLDVRMESADSLVQQGKRFDVITLAHVIEHVHDPVRMLSDCYELLNPGGTLWIETPNIEAQGHELYGASWRGLEPPRHLVLFTHEGLSDLLVATGFSSIEIQPYRPQCRFLYVSSNMILKGEDPYGDEVVDKELLRLIDHSEKRAVKSYKCREFITMSAKK